MNRQLKIERTFHMPEPQLRLVEIHELNCDCIACAPYVPSDPDRLTAVHIGKLACAGVVVGSVLMFAINPSGAAAALLATIGIVS